MLIRLENGDWVDPRAVTAIEFLPSYEESYPGAGFTIKKVTIRAKAKVRLGHSSIVIGHDTDDQAKEARDRIAAQVNAALEGIRP